jgi:hypothetical protein
MKAKALKESTRLTAPRPTIHVSQEDIDRALPKTSRHCMIEFAIMRIIPNATHVMVDIQTIRWSDKDKGLRYIYFTPAKVIAIMLAWDEGYKPKPFSFRLRSPQIISTRIRHGKKENGKRTDKRVHALGKRRRIIESGDQKKRMRPTVIGGKPPPLTRYHNQRIFGSRTLAGLVGGADLVAMLQGLQRA